MELQQVYDSRNASATEDTAGDELAAENLDDSVANQPRRQVAVDEVTPENLNSMDANQLRRLVLQLSEHFNPLPTPHQSLSQGSQVQHQDSQFQHPVPQLQHYAPATFPLDQSQLRRDRNATASANTFLQDVGIQNLSNRVPDSVYPARQQYPSPAPTLRPQAALLPAASSPQQQLWDLLTSSVRHSSTERRAIQLTDFIPASMSGDEERVLTAVDGQIKLTKPRQQFFDVPHWAAMAMTSSLEFCRLARKQDPRMVSFNILDYLFYLQTVFLNFSKFKFNQVLAFDRAYRTLQLREKWAWGTHVPELFQYYLSGHNKTKPLIPKSTNPKKRSFQPMLKCGVFNAGDQCPYNPCRYQHRCTICNSAHPAVKCPVAGKPKPS